MTNTDDSTTLALDYDVIKTQIQAAYDQLKQSAGFRERGAQKQMIGMLARHFARAGTEYLPICVIEAGTGTGKTFGVLFAVNSDRPSLEKKLVISTGTIALQEQLVNHDLPALSAISGLSFTYALVKGRRRYLCPLKLSNTTTAVQTVLFDMGNLAEQAQTLAHELSEGWNGDFDTLDTPIDESAQLAFSTDASGCIRKNCLYFSECPYLTARSQMFGADVIVANHALLISDLAIGSGAVLPTLHDCFHVIDEGHHLPSEVLSHTASSHLLHGAQSWLEALTKVAHGLGDAGNESFKEKVSLKDAQISQACDVLKDRLQQLYAAFAKDTSFHPNEVTQHRFKRTGDPHITRFEHGQIPELLQTAGSGILSVTKEIKKEVVAVIEWINEALSEEKDDHLLKQLIDLSFFSDRLDNIIMTWQLMLEDKPTSPHAKWIEYRLKGDSIDFLVAASPIEAHSFLNDTLFKESSGVAITSATLTALGRFDFYFAQCGLTYDQAQALRLASPFDYPNRARLDIPQLPDPSQTQAHTQAIIDWSIAQIDPSAGTLMLFTSHKQMKDVSEQLSSYFTLHIQGTAPKNRLIESHKARIDAGKGSVLMGLNSFGEGLNLPGDYCTHVVIAKIPFPVPSSPVEKAQAEYLESTGGNSFMDISVPIASSKLTQWSGRLLRTEEDHGKVSILDVRLINKSYGRMMIQALPNFARET